MYRIVQREERSANVTPKTPEFIGPSTTSTATNTSNVVTQPVRIAKAPQRNITGTASPAVSTVAVGPGGLSSSAVNTLRTEIGKNASAHGKQSVKDAVGSSAGKAQMDASIRLIDDEFELIDALKDFLNESNTKYSVIGVLGAQGTGKSTVLSMLAGNNPADMYRQYIFRPAAREAVEACRYQTTRISVYVVPKMRTFFLDCQPLNCAPLLEDFSRARRVKGSEALDANELESLQLLLLLSSVCHTIVLCIDWFIDLGIVRRLMRTELFFPILFPHSDSRRVNLVVLHQRAKANDLSPLLVSQRMRMLNAMFVRSSFNINGGLTMAKLGFAIYEQMCTDSDVNYILLGELKPRTRMDEFEQYTKHPDDYGTVVSKLRNQIYHLPNNQSNGKTEAQWFAELSETWKRIREELPTLTEDGCALKRHRCGGGQSHLFVALKSAAQKSPATMGASTSRNTPMLKQRIIGQMSEFARGKSRGRGRRNGNWENEELANTAGTAEDGHVEMKYDEQQKSETLGEAEGHHQVKKKVWRRKRAKFKERQLKENESGSDRSAIQ